MTDTEIIQLIQTVYRRIAPDDESVSLKEFYERVKKDYPDFTQYDSLRRILLSEHQSFERSWNLYPDPPLNHQASKDSITVEYRYISMH